MPDAILRVQTKYPNAEALLVVVGPTLSRGLLRVPIAVTFEQSFELVLASLDGADAVSGSAEVVEHAGDATWLRFLSATPTGDDTRCVLVDSEVMSPSAVMSKSEAFEVITAVGDTPDLAPMANRETAPVNVSVIGEPPAMPDGDPDDDLRIPHTGVGIPLRVDTVESPAIVINRAPEEHRPTVAAPALSAALAVRTARTHADSVAAERGMRAITAPSLRTLAQHSPERQIVFVAVAVAILSMMVAVASVLWAASH